MNSVDSSDGVSLDDLTEALARVHPEGTATSEVIDSVRTVLQTRHLPRLERQCLVRTGEVRQEEWKVREGVLFSIGCKLLDDVEAVAPRADAADIVRARIVPQWAQEYTYPVVVRPTRYSEVVHALDPSSEMLAPACNPSSEIQRWEVKERAVFAGFRSPCQRDPWRRASS